MSCTQRVLTCTFPIVLHQQMAANDAMYNPCTCIINKKKTSENLCILFGQRLVGCGVLITRVIPLTGSEVNSVRLFPDGLSLTGPRGNRRTLYLPNNVSQWFYNTHRS